MTARADGRVTYRTTEHKVVASSFVDFGVEDDRGRVIGVRINLQRIVEEETQNDERPYAPVARPEELGVWHGLHLQPTREGAPYGSATWYRYRTEAERSEALERYLKGARARARRKGGRRVGGAE